MSASEVRQRNIGRTMIVLGLYLMAAALILSAPGTPRLEYALGYFVIGFGSGLAFAGWTYR